MTKGEALIKLRDFLKDLPEEKFNFDKWVTSYKKDENNNPCGTACCAYGWIPQAVPELGITWIYTESGKRVVPSASYKEVFGASTISSFMFTFIKEDLYPFYDTKLHGFATEVTLTHVINRINTVLHLFPTYCKEEIILPMNTAMDL